MHRGDARCAPARGAGIAGPDFIPGLELGRRFYLEVVRPLLDDSFPELPHSAALIGPGSEVLGFDSRLSTDHAWGPRVQLFLSEQDHQRRAGPLRAHLREALPTRFLGHSTHFSVHADGSKVPLEIERGPVDSLVAVTTLDRFFRACLGMDIESGLAAADWLALPQQILLALTAGEVFHDDLGLERLRAKLQWYPHDVWLYLLASGWMRISQEEPFVGRTGIEGDDLGSRLVAGRLVRDVMRLGFLMERRYAPYAKWLGRAFAGLRCAGALTPALERALDAEAWREREAALCDAYRELASLHNALGVTDPLPTAPTPFHERPFRVIHGERFAKALRARISDASVRAIAEKQLIGSLDQFSDSTDLAAPEWHAALRRLYEPND